MNNDDNAHEIEADVEYQDEVDPNHGVYQDNEDDVQDENLNITNHRSQPSNVYAGQEQDGSAEEGKFKRFEY